MTKHLVLVGGGHTHALLLKKLVIAPIDNLQVTLVSPNQHSPYSGMLPGLIAGHYTYQDIHIDLEKLTQCNHATFIRSKAKALDPDNRRLILEDNTSITYDLLSFDTGATPDLSVPGSADYSIPVKPIDQFHERWAKLHQDIENTTQTSPFVITIIGTGAAGIELALAIQHKIKHDHHHPISIQIVSRTKDILSGYPTRLKRYIHKQLTHADIRIIHDCDIIRVTPTQLFAKNGTIIESSAHVWCTQVRGAKWLEFTHLSLSQEGFIDVRPTLQTISHDNIFAVGDVSHFIHQPLPKAGVYAVRMVDTLYKNINAMAEKTPLIHFQPQQDFLSLLACGNKTAVGCKYGITIKGQWVWRLKDYIDRTFMRQFQELKPTAAPSSRQVH